MALDIAVTFTISNRPHYLDRALRSWRNVRGVDKVKFYFGIEPSQLRMDNSLLIFRFMGDVRAKGKTYYNEERLGVLENPYVCLNDAFKLHDYVILAEEDIEVSSDILEYHTWAAETYENDKEIGAVCSWNGLPDTHMPNGVLRSPAFPSVWLWGTWRDRWNEYIGPTWDHDYSSSVGYDSGWDWNMNKRVFPAKGKKSIVPLISRSNNFGAIGTHNGGIPMSAPSFQLDIPAQEYREFS